MDDLDHQLMRYLRRDARLPVASLASAAGISRATAKARIDKLVAIGAITAFTIECSEDVRTAIVRALVQIEVTGRMGDRVTQQLLRMPEVSIVHSTIGRWDLIAELEAPDLGRFDDALRRVRQIEGVSLTESNILLTSSKSSGL